MIARMPLRPPTPRSRPRRVAAALLAVVLGLSGAPSPAPVAAVSGVLVTSQLGYAPGDPMGAVLAVATGTAVSRGFQVVSAANPATVVWSSAADAAQAFPGGWSGNDALGDTYRLDLSAASLAAGTYRVASNGLLSAPFTVAADAYDIARLRPLEFFRIQGADAAVSWTALDGAVGGHGPDHLDDARQATKRDKGGGDTALIQQDQLALPGGRLDASGGWSDAGDYNKYMGNTPWAAYLLLLAAEERPAYWDRVDEDGDGVPDIRELVAPALDWMLKLQWTDGSVFERVFNGYGATFDGRPDLETDGIAGTADDRPLDTDRYADIAAKSVYAWAAGYRVLGDARYLAAAEKAWDWAFANQTRLKPKAYGGGLYFGDIEQGLTLGALELHRAKALLGTPPAKYLDYATGRVRAHLAARDWANPSSWDAQPSYALRRAYEVGSLTSGDRSRIVDQLAGRIDGAIARQAANAYRMDDEWLYGDFGQNENSTSAAGDALWLHGITGQRRFYDFAVDQLAWVFGRNPFGESWLAGASMTEYTRSPHWRATAKHAISGVVVPGATDRNANGRPDYTDTGDWFYAEPSLNQQAMFVRVMTELFHASGGTVSPPADVPPAVTILEPSAGTTLSGTVTVSARATDASGVAAVAYRIDGGPRVAMTRAGSASTDPWTASLATGALADGLHELVVTATDGTGLTASPSVTVSVRNGAAPALHVERIDVVLLKKGGSRWQGRCDVTVADAFGIGVPSVTIAGRWSGSATDTYAVTSASTGIGTDYSNSSTVGSGARYTCAVDSLARAGWTYDAGANRVGSASATVP